MANFKMIIVAILFSIGLTGCSMLETVNSIAPNDLTLNREITTDACDKNGKRQSNVKVDVGYGDRVYYAYTNQYKQLVRVEAAEIIAQSKSEPLTNKGRYCNDEAKVEGTKRDNFDEGHVIADSLGGVSNAYNITPEDSQLNREGAQAQIEEKMRQELYAGKKITEFTAVITYPDTETKTPTHYQFTMRVNNKIKQYEFDNK